MDGGSGASGKGYAVINIKQDTLVNVPLHSYIFFNLQQTAYVLSHSYRLATIPLFASARRGHGHFPLCHLLAG